MICGKHLKCRICKIEIMITKLDFSIESLRAEIEELSQVLNQLYSTCIDIVRSYVSMQTFIEWSHLGAQEFRNHFIILNTKVDSYFPHFITQKQYVTREQLLNWIQCHQEEQQLSSPSPKNF